MDKIFEVIKNYLTTDFSDWLKKFEDTNLTLPELTEKTCVFGPVYQDDIKSKVFCSVLPETQNNIEGTIDGVNLESAFTVTFIFKGSSKSVLIKQMCRYADAFNTALLNDYQFNSDIINDCEIGQRTFYCDAGATDNILYAVEIPLTVSTVKEI